MALVFSVSIFEIRASSTTKKKENKDEKNHNDREKKMKCTWLLQIKKESDKTVCAEKEVEICAVICFLCTDYSTEFAKQSFKNVSISFMIPST